MQSNLKHPEIALMQKSEVVVEIERLPLPKSPLPSKSQGAVVRARRFPTLMDAKPYMEQHVQDGYKIKVTTPREVMDHEKVLAWLKGMSLRRPLLKPEDGAKFYGHVKRAGDAYLASCHAELDNGSSIDVEQPETMPCQTLEAGFTWIDQLAADRGFQTWIERSSDH
jgi:hypothetical protein